jgi:hypothetical protein
METHRFNGQEDLVQTLHRHVYLYNQQLPQSALQSKTPAGHERLVPSKA